MLGLPPDTLDLNPIEQVFSKPKRLLRNAAPRALSTLREACGEELEKFTPAELKHDLVNSGDRDR